MTKPEEFATFKTWAGRLMADVFVGGEQYAYLTVPQAKIQCKIINAAFQKALSEAVREAEQDADDAGEVAEAWRHVALLIGEHLGRTGPVGYYDFTPEQFRDWALEEIKAIRTPEEK